MKRLDERQNNELRPVKITRHYTKYAQGSVLIEVGETKVLCSAMIEDKVPPFLRGEKCGWITAEYAMLPSATETRKQRDRNKGKVDGRSVEIQRLIGRSLRSVVDLSALGERTIWIDCDVIQADGGTRTASITGAYVALFDALSTLVEAGELEASPLTDFVAATSVGICRDEIILDLCYAEDSTAAVDMNLVMTGSGQIIEIQGTGEERPFTRGEYETMMSHAEEGIKELIDIQKKALELSVPDKKVIVLATGNIHKAKEINDMLGDSYRVMTMGEAGIDVDIIEDGNTFEDNALIKIRTIAPYLEAENYILMADDSGLAVDALAGAPGIYSARYAGEEVSYADNNKKLIAEMKDVEEDRRGAEFICVIAIGLPNGEEITVKGIVRGKIARELHGDAGFGFDPLFEVEGMGKTYAELSAGEKNEISHRAVAVRKAKSILDAT